MHLSLGPTGHNWTANETPVPLVDTLVGGVWLIVRGVWLIVGGVWLIVVAPLMNGWFDEVGVASFPDIDNSGGLVGVASLNK